MPSLFKLFLDICLLRASPDQLPASKNLLLITLLSYAVVSLILARLELPLGSALLYAVLDTLVLAIITHTVLLLRRFPARLTQTLTALAGTGSLLGLIALPLAGFAGASPALLLLVLWNIVVTAHILRHALAVPLMMGLVASMAYLLMTFFVMSALFPPAAN